MILKSLTVKGFRNYQETQLQFASVANFLTGQNGQGKTNLLEAIYYLSIFRSFRTNVDSELVNKDQKLFFLDGSFLLADDNIQSLSASYQMQEGKRIKENGKRVKQPSKIIGSYPVTIVSPEQYVIVNGPPAERRRFIDILLSQTDQAYLQDLIDYNHLVKQKNRLLSNQLHFEGRFEDLLYPWNHSIAEVGSRILHKRFHFIKTISESLRSNYKLITNTDDDLNINYFCTIFGNKNELCGTDQKSIFDFFQNRLQELESREKERGMMLEGPHRDDLIINLNDKNSRKFASQGEQKTILLTLKISESQYIEDCKGEPPILLLDDLFSMLDDVRSDGVLNFVTARGQFFITTTDPVLPGRFRDTVPQVEDGYCHYSVQQGEVYQ